MSKFGVLFFALNVLFMVLNYEHSNHIIAILNACVAVLIWATTDWNK